MGAMILTGGASRRMGADKAGLIWFGRPAVEVVAETATRAGAKMIVTVGPHDHGVPRVQEARPLGGPVGAITAGTATLRALGCDRVLVMSADAPSILPVDLAVLVESLAPGAAYDGLHLPMVIDIAALPADAPANWPIGRLAQEAGLARPSCPPHARVRLRGANTPEEWAALEADAASKT